MRGQQIWEEAAWGAGDLLRLLGRAGEEIRLLEGKGAQIWMLGLPEKDFRRHDGEGDLLVCTLLERAGRPAAVPGEEVGWPAGCGQR